MIVPAGGASFAEALRIGAEVFHALKTLLHERGFATAVGDEGGFAPDLPSSEEAIEVVLEAAERAGLPPSEIAIALDPAATELCEDGAYRFEGREKPPTTRWSSSGPTGRRAIRSSRSRTALAEDDWDGWKALTERLGERVQLVGDDLFVTNPERLGAASSGGVANAILVKVNQIGTLTETLEAIALAHARGYAAVISHRSRRDGGHDDRRPRGRHERGPDQDRRAVALGARREVQPAAAHRGGARRPRRRTPAGRRFRALVAHPSLAGASVVRGRSRACPGGRPATRHLGLNRKEGVHGGTMGSPMPSMVSPVLNSSYPRRMATVGRRRTKIVATVGPATSDRASLRALVDAGLDGARLNLSHGTHDEHAARVRLLREVQEEYRRPLALIADLQGPKLRSASCRSRCVSSADRQMTLVGGEHPDNGALPVSPAVIGDVLRPGHDVLSTTV